MKFDFWKFMKKSNLVIFSQNIPYRVPFFRINSSYSFKIGSRRYADQLYIYQKCAYYLNLDF